MKRAALMFWVCLWATSGCGPGVIGGVGSSTRGKNDDKTSSSVSTRSTSDDVTAEVQSCKFETDDQEGNSGWVTITAEVCGLTQDEIVKLTHKLSASDEVFWTNSDDAQITSGDCLELSLKQGVDLSESHPEGPFSATVSVKYGDQDSPDTLESPEFECD